MSVSYDLFDAAFLSKITEFEFIKLPEEDRTEIVDGYLHRAVAAFRKNCKYDLYACMDDSVREFDCDIDEDDIDELVEIVSEGMVVQWLICIIQLNRPRTQK